MKADILKIFLMNESEFCPIEIILLNKILVIDVKLYF
jgi:hypothetical protein